MIPVSGFFDCFGETRRVSEGFNQPVVTLWVSISTGKSAHPTGVDTSLTTQATGCCCLATATGVEELLKFLLHLFRSLRFSVT